MFNKNILLLVAILSTYLQQKNHEANSKTIDRNQRAVNYSKNLVRLHKNHMKASFGNLDKIHKFIKRHGINVPHQNYNKIVARYSRLLKDYNKKRDTFCAKLPKIWALRNKDKSELTPMEIKCKNWYYNGQVKGNNIAYAFNKLANIKHYSSSLANKCNCYKGFINAGKKPSSTVMQFRECYNKGFHAQLKNSMDGFRTNNKKLLVMKKPFKSYGDKVKAMKKAIKNVKRVMPKKK